jgi:hypothetical protein
MYTVRKVRNTYGVFFGTVQVEGGFFSKAAAQACADDLNS